MNIYRNIHIDSDPAPDVRIRWAQDRTSSATASVCGRYVRIRSIHPSCWGTWTRVPLARLVSQSVPDYSCMLNVLSDFPPDRFAIHAACDCGHMAPIDTTRLPADLPVPVLRDSLRCRVCGGPAAGIRIIWTAAGGFAHSG